MLFRSPVVAPASAPSRTGTGRKRPSRRKSVVATAAARGPLIETTLTMRERRAIAAAILGTGSVETAPAVAPKPTKRRALRPRHVTKPDAPLVATPVASVTPVVATISATPVTVTSTKVAVGQPGAPVVSGPSPVGDLTGSVGATLPPVEVSAPVVVDPANAEQLMLGDASTGKREAAQAAFSDALSHLVTTLSADDGRPASELERARLRKFLQISRIYLDNLAVKLKD